MHQDNLPAKTMEIVQSLSPINKAKFAGRVAMVNTKYNRLWGVAFFTGIVFALVFAMSRDPLAAGAAALAGFLLALWIAWR